MSGRCMKIAVLASKGGVGKSTVSLLLYGALRKAGRSVAIRDWDKQGTCTKSLAVLKAEPEKPGVKYDVLILDTPPALEHTATAAAVREADVVLVITTPSFADLWEAELAVNFAKKKNKRALVRLLFNKVQPRTTLGRDEAREENADVAKITANMLDPVIEFRQCYQHAVGLGYKALNTDARIELGEVAVAVLGLR